MQVVGQDDLRFDREGSFLPDASDGGLQEPHSLRIGEDRPALMGHNREEIAGAGHVHAPVVHRLPAVVGLSGLAALDPTYAYYANAGYSAVSVGRVKAKPQTRHLPAMAFDLCPM
jgi:hypothetical protein